MRLELTIAREATDIANRRSREKLRDLNFVEALQIPNRFLGDLVQTWAPFEVDHSSDKPGLILAVITDPIVRKVLANPDCLSAIQQIGKDALHQVALASPEYWQQALQEML